MHHIQKTAHSWLTKYTLVKIKLARQMHIIPEAVLVIGPWGSSYGGTQHYGGHKTRKYEAIWEGAEK